MDLEIATLSELPQEMARRTGYRIVNHRLDFFGICPRCQAMGGDEVPGAYRDR